MDSVFYFIISTFAGVIIYIISPFIHEVIDNYDVNEYEFVDYEIPKKEKQYKSKKGDIYE